MGGNGGIREGRSKDTLEEEYIMWEGCHRQGGKTQKRQVGILQYLTMLMDSDCNGVSGGKSVMGGV